MSALQIAVLALFLLALAAAIACIAVSFYRRWKADPTREEQYDERQRTARGGACRIALGTVVICELASVLAWAVCGLPEWGLALCVELGLDLGVVVFICTAIWKHAYLRLCEKPGGVFAGCGAVCALGLLLIVVPQTVDMGGTSASAVMRGIECITAALAVAVVQGLRLQKDRQEERADLDA